MKRFVYALKKNGYLPMQAKLDNAFFFAKENGESVDIVVVVDNETGFHFKGSHLLDIKSQLERKYFLTGKRYVNIQFVVVSNDINRDKRISEESELSFWVYYNELDEMFAYENSSKEFEKLLEDFENCKIENLEGEESKKRFRIPYVTIALVLINVAVYLATEMTGSSLDTSHMLKLGASEWRLIYQNGEYYRLFTCMFLHFGIAHLFSNMFSLFIIGSEVERCFGKFRFLMIYICSGLFASVISSMYYMNQGAVTVSAGASGAIFGINGAMLVGIYLLNKHNGEGFIRKFILLLIVALYGGSADVDNMAHVGGFVAGVILSALISVIFPLFKDRENKVL